jgi:serine phosphatase RsbU (regulator of sigma subunit)
MNMEPENVLSGALWLTNDYITREHSESNMFITVFYGMLHLDSGKLVYVNAGHNPPLLVNTQEYRIRELPDVAALPLGIFEHQDYGSSHLSIDTGDYLVAFSDGITEAMNHTGELYGDRRLHQSLLAQSGLSAAELVKTVIGDADEYVGDAAQADDITILVLHRIEKPAAAV